MTRTFRSFRLTVSQVAAPAVLVIAALGVSHAASAEEANPGKNFGPTMFISPSGQPFRALGTDPYPVAVWFAQADTNKDGKISQDEFVNDATAFFKKLDRNHDGYINSPENTIYETDIAPEITRMDPRITQPTNYRSESDTEMGADTDRDPTRGRYQKSIQGASQYGLIDEPQPVRAADANIDFRVSTEEWINASNQRFAMLDRNGDGFLTLEELPKTPVQWSADAFKDGKTKGKGKKKGFGMW